MLFVGVIYSVAGDVGLRDVEMGADDAANTEITLPSARERIIQSVGVHLL
mgnify:CR=1 FL=1